MNPGSSEDTAGAEETSGSENLSNDGGSGDERLTSDSFAEVRHSDADTSFQTQDDDDHEPGGAATAGNPNLDVSRNVSEGDITLSNVTRRRSGQARNTAERTNGNLEGDHAQEDGNEQSTEGKTSLDDLLQAQEQRNRNYEQRQSMVNNALLTRLTEMANAVQSLATRIGQMPTGNPGGKTKSKGSEESLEDDGADSNDDSDTDSTDPKKVKEVEEKIEKLERRTTMFIKQSEAQRGVDQAAARNEADNPTARIAETIKAPTLKSQEKSAIFAFQAKRNDYEAKVPLKQRIALRGMMAPVIKRLFLIPRPKEIEEHWDKNWVHSAQISTKYLKEWLQLHAQQNDEDDDMAARVSALERDLVKIQANMKTANPFDRISDFAEAMEKCERTHLGIDPVTKLTRMHPGEDRMHEFILLAVRPMSLGIELWKQKKGKTLVIDGEDVRERRMNLLAKLISRGKAMRKKSTGNPLLWEGVNEPDGKKRSKMQWKGEWALSPILHQVVGKERALQLVTNYNNNKDKPPKKKGGSANSTTAGNGDLEEANLKVRKLEQENAELKKKKKRKRPLSCWICAGEHYSNKCTHANATDEMRARPSSYYFNLINEAQTRGETWKAQFSSK